MRRALLYLVAGAIACGIASPVLAQRAASVSLDYRADPAAGNCLTEQQLRARVVARTGFDPFAVGGQRRLAVRIERGPGDGGGLVGEISFDDGTGQPAVRRLSETTTDCRAMGETLALLIGLTVESLVAAADDGLAEGVAAGAAGTPAGPPRALGPLPHERADAAVEGGSVDDALGPGGDRTAVTVAATGLVSVGAGPDTAAGLAVRLGAQVARYSIALEGRLDASSALPFGVGEIRAALRAASLVPCRRWRGFSLCGLATAGALRARGDGYVDDRSTLRPYIGLGARSAGEVGLAPGLVGQVHWDVTAALLRGGVEVSDEAAWTQPLVALTFGVTLVVDFR